jgi:hypothetical protein
VNTGILIDSIYTYRYISEAGINTYPLTQKSIKTKLKIDDKYKLYFALSLSISKNGTKLQIAELKLGEILA